MSTNPNIQDLLKSLRENYIQGQYKDGIELLKANQAVLNGYDYHSNLGLFFLKTGQLGQARLHLEQAQDISLFNFHAEQNLIVLKKQLPEINELEYSALDFIYSKIFMVFLLILLIMTFFSSLSVLWNKKRKRLKITAIIFSFLFLCTGLRWLVEWRFKPIVITEEAKIYEGPNTLFKDNGLIPPGLKLYREKEFEGWSFVAYPKFYRGWVAPEKNVILQRK
jgi:hypothetical protein